MSSWHGHGYQATFCVTLCFFGRGRLRPQRIRLCTKFLGCTLVVSNPIQALPLASCDRSEGAPWVWGRFLALMGRLSQVVVGTHDLILVVTRTVVERQEMIGLFTFCAALDLKRTVWPNS